MPAVEALSLSPEAQLEALRKMNASDKEHTIGRLFVPKRYEAIAQSPVIVKLHEQFEESPCQNNCGILCWALP